jgi:hypothetical protein
VQHLRLQDQPRFSLQATHCQDPQQEIFPDFNFFLFRSVPDIRQIRIRIWICITMESRTRIRIAIKAMPIHNTGEKPEEGFLAKMPKINGQLHKM